MGDTNRPVETGATTANVREIAASAAQETAHVVATRLSKRIDDRPIIEDLNFRLNAGDYVGILGANGAGKSTLLKLLATLIQPTEGELHLFGQSVARSSNSAIRARIGMIGHQSMLYRDLSARENLEFFARLYSLKEPKDRVNELLEYIGLADRADDAIKAFSRGMLQRVSIARALLHEPDLLLADEPFTGLDAPSVRMVERMLAGLHDQGTTIILVNHDIGQTIAITERSLVLRSGRLIINERSDRLDAESVLEEVSKR